MRGKIAQPVLSVPTEMTWVGPERFFFRQTDSFSLEASQQHRSRPSFPKARGSKDDSVVVRQ